MNALTQLFKAIPADYEIPILVVQHRLKSKDNYFITYYDEFTRINVMEAEEKCAIAAGNIYFAPADYHLLVEEDKTVSLTVDERVNFSRPSIDVLFESASEVYAAGLIGILLTGANNDGAAGLRTIQKNGGLAIVQNPQEAEFPAMPQSALDIMEADFAGTLEEIASYVFKKI